MSFSRVVTRVVCVLAATGMLVAILFCALAPSPNMREVIWIPSWLGEWADRNGNFRNFPVFAALAALLFFVFTFYQRLVTRYGRWRLAFSAFLVTALLGASLEVAQLLFLPNRHFDWADIGWLAAGAFVGAFLSAACCGRSHNRQYFHYPKLHHDSFS